MHEYNSEATEAGLIPSTAPNANGKDYRFIFNPEGRTLEEMSSVDWENDLLVSHPFAGHMGSLIPYFIATFTKPTKPIQPSFATSI